MDEDDVVFYAGSTVEMVLSTKRGPLWGAPDLHRISTAVKRTNNYFGIQYDESHGDPDDSGECLPIHKVDGFDETITPQFPLTPLLTVAIDFSGWAAHLESCVTAETQWADV